MRTCRTPKPGASSGRATPRPPRGEDAAGPAARRTQPNSTSDAAQGETGTIAPRTEAHTTQWPSSTSRRPLRTSGRFFQPTWSTLNRVFPELAPETSPTDAVRQVVVPDEGGDVGNGLGRVLPQLDRPRDLFEELTPCICICALGARLLPGDTFALAVSPGSSCEIRNVKQSILCCKC